MPTKFDNFFINGCGITAQTVEWLLSQGDDEGLRQQEENVNLLLEIAQDPEINSRAELSETLADVIRHGFAYRSVLREHRTKFPKELLAMLSEHHGGMVAACRSVCLAVYPAKIKVFDALMTDWDTPCEVKMCRVCKKRFSTHHPESKYCSESCLSLLRQDVAKLSEDDVREIREAKRNGVRFGELGERYGVASAAIADVILRRP